MSALPQRGESPSTKRIRILKLFNMPYTLDPFEDRLISQGYHVHNAENYSAAIAMAHEERPALIIVYDSPDHGVDAFEWIRRQHTDRFGWMATTPLIILADGDRAAHLKSEELPDRIMVLRRHADTLNTLTRLTNRLLRD